MTNVVLASGSKTRSEMLKNAGLSFEVLKPTVDEEGLKAAMIEENAPPRDIADALADMKARSVSMEYAGAYVIGADQILVKDGKVFSKASDRLAAVETLRALSGGEHELLSAVVVYHGGQPVWRTVDTVKLSVRPLSDQFIHSYLDEIGEDAFWSVGCYQIEGRGAQLFTHVKGDYFTVLGLPLLSLLDYFRRVEVMPI